MQTIVKDYAIFREGLILCSFMIALINCFTISMGSRLDPRGGRYLFRIAFSSWLLTLTYLADLWLTGRLRIEIPFLSALLISLEHFILFAILYCAAGYIIYQIEEGGETIRGKRLPGAFGLIYAVMLIGNLFHPFLFKIEKEETIFQIGNDPLIWDAMSLAFLLGMTYLLLRYSKCLRREVILSFLIMLIAPGLALIIRRESGGIDIMEFAVTVSAFIMGLFAEAGQAAKYRKQEEEISRLHSQLLLSQLRPHFLYNALSSISQLCKYDPEQASVMTDNFSEFLTKNLRDVMQSEPLPFVQELKYIQSYVAIEKMRFGEDLKVIYNIEETDFYVPPMVVQPIIENSIKHGLGAKEEGGHLYISSREFKNAYGIIIADDGVGFDTKYYDQPKDDRVHVGLASIRQRFNRIPGAQIVTESSPGHGTSTILIIPKDYSDGIRHKDSQTMSKGKKR